MSDTIRAALLFLITTVFDLYLFLLVIRVVLAWSGANYFNPVVQFIVKFTDVIVKPVRRFIPNVRGIEISTILLIFIIEVIKFSLIASLSFGFPNLLGLFVLAFADALKLTLEVFFYAILLQAIISWVQPGAPINQVLHQFTAPIMRPFQRIVPPVSGVDISPIPAMIVLQLLIIVVVKPLMGIGLSIAFT